MLMTVMDNWYDCDMLMIFMIHDILITLLRTLWLIFMSCLWCLWWCYMQIYDCVSLIGPPVYHVYVYEWFDGITTAQYHKCSFGSPIDKSVPSGSLNCLCSIRHIIVIAGYHRCFFWFTGRMRVIPWDH